jgi:hypothetical protein
MPTVEGPDDLSDVTPGEYGWPRVEFRGRARPGTDSRRAQYEKELSYVFGTAWSEVDLVLVVEPYAGYSQASGDKDIFGIELRFRGSLGYETHIAKLGTDAEVGRDADNWKACTADREVASRIFAPTRKQFIRGGGRVAVIYRDAYTLFGPTGHGGDVAPHYLENVASDAVFTNTIDPRSVERAIAHIFTDLSLWFFQGAESDVEMAGKFYRKELVSTKQGKDTLAVWGYGARLELRRDALWLFCGRDRPDQNHAENPARYLDPVELVGWSLETGAVPATLVGRGHGDLHGRNVLLGVRRRAAEYPAVFDYGGMGTTNALAWDFAKLETELKVRLLQQLYRYDRVHEAVQNHKSWTWKKGLADRHDATTHRAERLRFFFVIEEMLAERTEWITNPGHATAWQPPGGRKSNQVTMLDRLLALLLRIRQEAALALGFSVGRIEEWRDELYFALAVYGLVNARWKTYTQEEQESALVSAGVAAAHARFARAAVAGQADNTLALPAVHYPSYRVPLAHAHAMWKGGHQLAGKTLLDGLIERYAHAVPLIAEHALFRCELGNFADYNEVQKHMAELSTKAAAFEDAETLTRLGRALKEMGDKSWENSGLSFAELHQLPAVQFYRNALKAYEAAHRLSHHYYPGANVAGLALLTGDVRRAEEVAKKLLQDCEPMNIPPEEFYWNLATEGDAALILHQGERARTFYQNAINVLHPGEEQYAVSSYRQLLRLRGPLGIDLVNPILNLFETNRVIGPMIQAQVTRRIPC